MTLNEYLDREGIKKYKFAEKTGISLRTISSACNGYKLNLFMSKIIEVFTDGEVTADEIVRKPKQSKKPDLEQCEAEEEEDIKNG